MGGLARGVEGMEFSDNDGLPEFEGGELGIGVDNEGSDEDGGGNTDGGCC